MTAFKFEGNKHDISCENTDKSKWDVYNCLPLTKDGFSTRILTVLPGAGEEPIRCQLRTAVINAQASYDALSYTWGEGTTTSIIHVNSSPFRVTPNLHDALHALRLHCGRRKIWIDAICINQEDVTERAEQVAEMGYIYRNANRVMIWLGQGSRDTDLVMSMVERHEWPSDDPFRRIWAATGLSDILSRRWFTRIWVVQELSMGVPDPLLICGESSLSWSTFIRFLRMPEINSLVFYHKELSSILRMNQVFHAMQMNDMRARVQKPPRLRSFTAVNDDYTLLEDDLFLWLKRTAMFEASDPRDKLYALLGLTRSLLLSQVSIDYKTPTSQIMRDLTVRQIRARNSLDLLTLCHLDRSPLTASWIPDLTVSGLPELPSTRYKLSSVKLTRHEASGLPSNATPDSYCSWIQELLSGDKPDLSLSIEDLLSTTKELLPNDKPSLTSWVNDAPSFMQLGSSSHWIRANIKDSHGLIRQISSTLPKKSPSTVCRFENSELLKLRGVSLGTAIVDRSRIICDTLGHAYSLLVDSLPRSKKSFVEEQTEKVLRICTELVAEDVSDITTWKLHVMERSVRATRQRLLARLTQVTRQHDTLRDQLRRHRGLYKQSRYEEVDALVTSKMGIEKDIQYLDSCGEFCKLAQELTRDHLQWTKLWLRLLDIEERAPQRTAFRYTRYFYKEDIMALQHATTGRIRFTDTGLLGLGPPDLQDGDRIAMLGNCTTAFAIRASSEPQTWTLVGPVVVCPPQPPGFEKEFGPRPTDYPNNWKPLKQETFFLK